MNYVTAGLIIAIILLILIVVGSNSYWGDVILMLLTVGLLVALNFAGTAFILEGYKPNVSGGGLLDGIKDLFSINSTLELSNKTTTDNVLKYAESLVKAKKITSADEQEIQSLIDRMFSKLSSLVSFRDQYIELDDYLSRVYTNLPPPEKFREEIAKFKTAENSWKDAWEHYVNAKNMELEGTMGPGAFRKIVVGDFPDQIKAEGVASMKAILTKLNVDFSNKSDEFLWNIFVN